MALILISTTQANWQAINHINQTLGLGSVTSDLEQKNISLGSPAAVIAGLGKIGQKETNTLGSLREPGKFARHASVSFLYSGDSQIILDVLLESKIEVIEVNYHMFILTANIEQWRDAILCFAKPDSRLAGLALQLLDQFDRIGCSYLFENYSRKVSPRGLLLTRK